MTVWTLFWLFWIAMFFAIEIPAIMNVEKGDTLTEHVQRWFSVKDKARWWLVRRAILLFFLALLLVHLMRGGWL